MVRLRKGVRCPFVLSDILQTVWEQRFSATMKCCESFLRLALHVPIRCLGVVDHLGRPSAQPSPRSMWSRSPATPNTVRELTDGLGVLRGVAAAVTLQRRPKVCRRRVLKRSRPRRRYAKNQVD